GAGDGVAAGPAAGPPPPDAPAGQTLSPLQALAVPAARELARQAAQAGLQAHAEEAEKKAPGRRCPHRQQPAWAKGRLPRAVLPAAGDVRLERLYLAGPRCPPRVYPLDQRLRLTGFVSPHARKLLCTAGTSWPFDRAAEHLAEFCALRTC